MTKTIRLIMATLVITGVIISSQSISASSKDSSDKASVTAISANQARGAWVGLSDGTILYCEQTGEFLSQNKDVKCTRGNI